MFWWLLVNIWIISSLIINYTLEAFARSQEPGFVLYPDWLEELHYAALWFMFLFNSITKTYADPGRTLQPGEPDLAEFKFVGVYGFAACLVATTVLRMNGVMVPVAYAAPFFGFVAIPSAIAILYFPIWAKGRKRERVSASRIIEITRQHQAVQNFVQHFPEAVPVVYGNQNMNDQAACIWFERRPCPQTENVREDILLEVFVHMKSKQVVEDAIHYSRYVFREEEDGTAAITLPPPDSENLAALNEPLDSFTIDKIESAVARFPLLGDYPLPIVTNKHIVLD